MVMSCSAHFSVCPFAAHPSCAEILCCRSQIPSLFDSDSGLLLLLYTIDDVRCVMWCESFVVVIDQFCGRDFVSTGWQRRILHPDMQVHCSVQVNNSCIMHCLREVILSFTYITSRKQYNHLLISCVATM